jgi:sugar/nucleoside kinase (ribokinase family)
VLAKAHAIVFSEHDHPNAEALARHIASRVPIVVLTRGARGATLFDRGIAQHVAAVPAFERDPTGAGDVFAAALAVWLGRDATPMDAAAQAAYCAARAVEGAGLGNL